MRRKEEGSKQGQTNNKAKHHSTPKAVSFPKKNNLPRVGLEPTTLYTLDRATCMCLAMYVCLSGLWLGGILNLYFLSVFLKLVCYAHVFKCNNSRGQGHTQCTDQTSKLYSQLD